MKIRHAPIDYSFKYGFLEIFEEGSTRSNKFKNLREIKQA